MIKEERMKIVNTCIIGTLMLASPLVLVHAADKDGVAVKIHNLLDKQAEIAIKIDNKIKDKHKVDRSKDFTFYAPENSDVFVLFDDGTGSKECQMYLNTSPKIGNVPEVNVKLNEKGEPSCSLFFPAD